MTATERWWRRLVRPVAVSGIAGRVFVHTAAIVCAVLVAALAVASHSGRRTEREAERRGLEQAADLTAQLLAGRGRSLAGGARVFVQGPYFRSLVVRRSHEDILDQAFEAAGQLAADWVFITDERGNLLAKSDEPAIEGVAMGGIPLVAGALEGRTTSGFGASGDSLLFQTVAVPIPVPRAAPVGVLVATKLLDHRMALDVRAATGAEVVFYALDRAGAPRVAAASFDSMTQAAALLPVALPNGAAAAAVGRGTGAPAGPLRVSHVDGVPFAVQGATLTTAGGEIIGGFVVARPETGMSAQIVGVRRSLLVAGLLGLALALAAAWSSARRVTRPARALASAATRALDGDYNGAARIAAEATVGAPADEVAALGTALSTLLEELREKQALVVLAAHRGPSGESAATSEEAPERHRPARYSGPGPRVRAPAASSRPLAGRFGARPSGALPAGAVIAERYEIHEVLGTGGSGIVYRAMDLTLGDVVALKMLRAELIADDTRVREELKHELRLTRRVSHRNVVRTHDFGTSAGVPFLTMEYVDGTSLASVLAHRGALPPAVVVALGKQLMRALEAAHDQGVVHGDLKPANVLVASDGLLKVSDFGVASLVRRPWSITASVGAFDDVVDPPRLAGAVIGTPEYMAPELLLGGRVDVRTDIYAAGMVLHECLTGATPFPRDTPRSFLAQKLETAGPRTRHPSPLPGPGEPASLDAIVGSMIAPEPEDRPQSAAEVSNRLAVIA